MTFMMTKMVIFHGDDGVQKMKKTECTHKWQQFIRRKWRPIIHWLPSSCFQSKLLHTLHQRCSLKAKPRPQHFHILRNSQVRAVRLAQRVSDSLLSGIQSSVGMPDLRGELHCDLIRTWHRCPAWHCTELAVNARAKRNQLHQHFLDAAVNLIFLTY